MDWLLQTDGLQDTYASTYLRMYFESYARGVPPTECPGTDGHNVDTIDALTVCGPVAIAAWARGLDRASAATEVEEFLRATRKSDVGSLSHAPPPLLLLYLARAHSLFMVYCDDDDLPKLTLSPTESDSKPKTAVGACHK